MAEKGACRYQVICNYVVLFTLKVIPSYSKYIFHLHGFKCKISILKCRSSFLYIAISPTLWFILKKDNYFEYLGRQFWFNLSKDRLNSDMITIFGYNLEIAIDDLVCIVLESLDSYGKNLKKIVFELPFLVLIAFFLVILSRFLH